MSEPIKLGVDATLRRLLEEPRPAPPTRRPRRAGATTVRACVALADATQLVLLCIALRPAFPAAAETFSAVQAFGFGLLAAMLALAARAALRPPDHIGREDTNAIASRAALAAFLSVTLVAVLCWVTLSQSVTPNPRGRTAWFLAWAMAASLGAASLRYAAARVAERLQSGRGVLVIGAPDQAAAVARQVRAAPPAIWRMAGSLDDRMPGALDTAVEAITRGGADMVVLAIAGPDAAERVAAVCSRLADQPVRICLALDTAGLPRATRIPFLDLADTPHGGLGGMAKRGLDLLLGGTALLLLSPLLVIAALAIKLDSPGPVFFRQWRFGLGSQPIEVMKFRTMRSEERDASGQRFTRARDPRVTRVGRFLRRTSIDELPQLLNVLRGDMSLVGPRPHPLHMRVGDTYYFEAVARYRMRHLIRPGITGWAQVNGSRGAVDTLAKAQRRVELDIHYIENWSLWLDLRILAATVLGGFLSLDAD